MIDDDRICLAISTRNSKKESDTCTASSLCASCMNGNDQDQFNLEKPSLPGDLPEAYDQTSRKALKQRQVHIGNDLQTPWFPAFLE